MRLYFFSPTDILSEFIWTNGRWAGGPGCTICIDTYEFAVQPGSRVLYALQNEAAGSAAELRVGFMSTASVLSEANYKDGQWSTAPLHT
jgi:hypothetical protein